jgi:proline iminopeptidase
MRLSAIMRQSPGPETSERSARWVARLACVLAATLFVTCRESDTHEGVRVTDIGAIEGYIESEGRSLWYRVVNPHGSGVPLLVQAGGPAPSYYLEPLESLADERPVVFYDQFGTGRSSKPDGSFNWSVQLYLEDLNALRAQLNLRQVHLLGHSWGTMLLSAYMETAPEGVKSVVLVSPSVSAARWLEDAEKLRAALPPETDAILREHEERAAFHEPAYQEAAMVFLQRHFCRLDPWPAALVETMEKMGPAYEAMWGPNEFIATGVLKDFDKTDVLGTITVPTLFIGGEYDEAPPETVEWHAEMVPDAQVVIIPEASHMPMLENPTLFNESVRVFLRNVESRHGEE